MAVARRFRISNWLAGEPTTNNYEKNTEIHSNRNRVRRTGGLPTRIGSRLLQRLAGGTQLRGKPPCRLLQRNHRRLHPDHRRDLMTRDAYERRCRSIQHREESERLGISEEGLWWRKHQLAVAWEASGGIEGARYRLAFAENFPKRQAPNN